MDYLIFAFAGLMAFDMLMAFRDSRNRQREVASGQAGIFTLRMLTGIPDREELTRRFGNPDATFHYRVAPEQVRAARTRARRVFDRPWIEPTLLGLAIVAGTYYVIQGDLFVSMPIIGAALLYHCLKRGHDLFVLVRCYRQMLEEGRVKMNLAKHQAG